MTDMTNQPIDGVSAPFERLSRRRGAGTRNAARWEASPSGARAGLPAIARTVLLTVVLPLTVALLLAACDIPGHSHAGWPPGY